VQERASVRRRVPRDRPARSSLGGGGLQQSSGLHEDLRIDLLQNATDGRADRAEVLPALEEADGRALCVLDACSLARYLRDPSGNGRVDARDAHLDVPGGQWSSPDEPVRIVE